MRLLDQTDLRWVAGGLDSCPQHPYDPNCECVEEIVVTGYREEEYDIWYSVADYDIDWSSFDDCSYEYTYSAPPPPTVEQSAAAFAANAVKAGDGFDPNNAQHQKQAAQVREALTKAYIAAHDGVEGATKLKDGTVLTDAQMRDVLNNMEVRLQTANLSTGESAMFFRATDETDVTRNYVTIDLDHSNIGTLTNNFGNLAEAMNFTVLHEIGHAIDRQLNSSTSMTEGVANYYAMELGGAFGLATPTTSEVTGSGYQITPPHP